MARPSIRKEREAYKAAAPERFQKHLEILRSHLPEQELALVGQQQILTYLESMGIRRVNGHRLNWRILLRWRRDEDFPLLRGQKLYRGRRPAMTSNYLVWAWLVSRFAMGDSQLFDVFVR